MFNKFLQKIGALTCNISLLLNSFLPYFTAIPAYALDSAPIVYNNSSHRLYFSLDTANYTSYQLFYKTNTKIDSVSGSKLPEYLYLGTCSDNTCLSQDFDSAILKIKTDSGFYFYYFTLKNSQLQIINEGNSSQLDLTEEEIAILEGVAPTSAFIPTPEITITPTLAPKVEQICLENDQEIIDSSPSDWNRDDSLAFSETKEKVKLGVKYNFPQENKVSVTFKCLPKDESLRTTLKIRQVKADDLKLPEDTNVSEYAYDITTGMVDGTFEYDVTLPKSSDKIAEVSYIEKTLEEAKTDISPEEIIPVSNIELQGDVIKANNVDHFTIFIIKTYKKFNGNLVLEENFYRHDTVYITATGIDLTSTRIRIRNPEGQVKKECNETLMLQAKCEYELPADASLGIWSIDLGHRFFHWWIWEEGVDTFNVKAGACGDGIIQFGEECDGTVGVTPGQNFCTSKTCKLIPIYDGPNTCPSGTVKSNIPVITKSVSSTDADGETFNLTPGKDYLLEVSGTFIPTSAPGYLSDAGYTLRNGSLSSQYGLIGTGDDYAAHVLLSNFGTNIVGVVNWGDYNSNHTYSKYFSFPDSSSTVQFVIGDRYADWFNTIYQNQSGMYDNSGSLNLSVYECRPTGSITFIKDANPDTSQPFYFVYGSNDYPIGDFELVDDNNGDNSETITFNSIPAGTYSWTESSYSDWNLTAVSCSDDNSTWDLNTKTININLDSGEDVTCTITNTKQAKLTVIKQVDIDNDGDIDNTNATDWKWDIVGGEQNIATGQSRILGAGTYTITEDQKSDYRLKEWTCSNQTEGTTNSVSVTLNPGDDITCTITNTRKTGSIRVCKVILDASGNIVDGSAITGSSFSISGLDQSTSQGSPAGVLGLTNFVTPLSYNTKLFGSSVNNALCITYPNLIPGNYYYGEENIPNNFWASPKYNDGIYNIPRNINDNFYEYSGQLFDDIPENDGSRQIASDGHIVLSPGQQNRTLIILNQYKFGNINVTKFNDLDGDGLQDEGENNLSGWTINLTGQTSVVTDDNGLASFSRINSGDYLLSENIQDGWVQTNISCDGEEIIDNDNLHQISLLAGQTINCKIGNRQLGNITVYKFNDLNGNGMKDEGENNLSGWTINLTGQTSVNTNEDGQANFNSLVPGDYELSENIDSQPGWTQTNIYCEDSNSSGVKITKTGEAYGHHGACEGWNGCGDAATCALWACEINGYDRLVSYGADKPCTEFSDCNLFYNRTSVDMDWVIHCGVRGVTDIVCSNSSGSNDSREGNYVSGNLVTVFPGQTRTCYIGNQRLPPRALISKWNNASSAGQPSGSSVQYKIKVKIFDNNVSNFNVTDLLSNGFVYRPGSYNIISSRLGDITSSIGEPQYHSPGVWHLGNLQAGDEIELSYVADISNDQQPGTYGDLTYALGDAAYDNTIDVLAISEPIGYVDENFSGTEVIVTKSTQNTISAGIEKEEIRQEGQVLGASTELPSTGSPTFWLIVSTFMSLLGFTLIKKSKNILIILLFSVFFIFPNNAKAISNNLSLRVEKPKTPTNISDVNLNFVALDVLSRPVIVKCYKKYATDVDFTQFGSDISLTAGGNANHCSLSSILTSEGNYQIKIIASAGADSAESIVSLDYKTSGPSAPIDYRKEHPNNCDYTIHFKTADDGGKTVKVEVYRSDTTSFNLDSGTFITAVDIGSNQEHDLTNSVPDCSKNYYYVLRAFDNAGNGSGATGDSVVKIITLSTTTTPTGSSTISQGAIPVTNATIAPETSITETTETETATAVPTVASEGEGSVLGTQKQALNFFQKYWLFLFLALFAGIAIIRYVLSKRKNFR